MKIYYKKIYTTLKRWYISGYQKVWKKNKTENNVTNNEITIFPSISYFEIVYSDRKERINEIYKVLYGALNKYDSDEISGYKPERMRLMEYYDSLMVKEYGFSPLTAAISMDFNYHLNKN